MKRFSEGDAIFDGFCHRSFNENIDGWRNAIPHESEFPCVQAAYGVIDLFEALCESRRRIWELEKQLGLWRPKDPGASLETPPVQP